MTTHISTEGVVIDNGVNIIKIFDKRHRGGFKWICDLSKELYDAMPNFVPRIYRTNKSKLSMVMEKIQGQTLYEFINSDKYLNVDETYSIVSSMIDAVNSMHQMGYIHGDLGPKNIIIDVFYKVKLIDFTMVECINDNVDVDNQYLKKYVAILIFRDKHRDINIMTNLMDVIIGYTVSDVIGNDERLWLMLNSIE